MFLIQFEFYMVFVINKLDPPIILIMTVYTICRTYDLELIAG